MDLSMVTFVAILIEKLEAPYLCFISFMYLFFVAIMIEMLEAPYHLASFSPKYSQYQETIHAQYKISLTSKIFEKCIG